MTFTAIASAGGKRASYNRTICSNVSGFSSFTPAQHILNRMKSSDGFEADGWETPSLIAAGHVNSDGYPRSFPAGVTEYINTFSYGSNVSDEFPGSYKLTWDGSATVSVTLNIDNVVSTSNQITFDILEGNLGNWRIVIGNAIPSPTFTNMVLVKTHDKNGVALDDETRLAAGEVFNPRWYNKLAARLNSLRFLNWSPNINNGISRGVLSADISDTDTSLTLKKTGAYEWDAAGDMQLAGGGDREIVSYTGRSDNADGTVTFTGLTRGQYTSVARAHIGNTSPSTAGQNNFASPIDQYVDWADRPKVSELSWFRGGVPYEVQLDLCKFLRVDAWFTLPLNASTDFYTNFADYMKANLAPGQRIRVENGNETWNTGFNQTTSWLTCWGLKNGWDTSFNSIAPRFSALCLKAMAEEFTGADRWRLINVVSGQGSGVLVATQKLSGSTWAAALPTDFNTIVGAGDEPAKWVDEVAITSYFGSRIMRDALEAANLVDYINNTSAVTQDVVDYIQSRVVAGASTAETKGWFDNHQALLTARYPDKVLSQYEGGQHVHHKGELSGAEANLCKDYFQAWVRSSYNAAFYQELWDYWKALPNAGLFSQYVDVSPNGAAGTWALYLNNEDTGHPTSVLLETLNDTEAPWWSDPRRS